MKIKHLLSTSILGGALLAGTASAQMEIPNDQYWDSGAPDKFRTVLAFPMLWAPGIDLEIETSGGQVDTTIDFSDILKNLDMGFMGELYFNKSWFGFYVKGMYMDVSPDSISQDLDLGPVGINADIDLNLKMGLYDFGLSWRLWRNLRLYTLGRLTQVDVNVQVSGSVTLPSLGSGCPSSPFCIFPGGTEKIPKQDIDVTPDDAWDYNMGLQYTWWLGRTNRHGINLYGDVALWGDSDSAWQIDARYMYRVSKLNNFWLGWRTYQTKTEEDDAGNQTLITISGPLAGWAFSF